MSVQNKAPGRKYSGLLGVLGTSVAVGALATVAITPALAIVGVTANTAVNYFDSLPSYLEIDDLAQKTDIYGSGSDGKPVFLASFFDQNRENVGWDQISQYAKDAAVSGEDQRFYEHGGIDLLGTIRAFVSNSAGNVIQGASSITQQYVKNVLINTGVENATTQAEIEAAFEAATAPTNARKIKEIRYAMALEKKYTKNEILRGYLNISHFGGRTYGIQAAAKYYFNTDASKLTIAQAAALMAIVQNPASLELDVPSSKSNGAETMIDGVKVPYAANKDRRDYIINRMYDDKKITLAERDEALSTVIAPVITPPSTGCSTAGSSGYFCDYVSRVIKKQFDDPNTTDVDEGALLLKRGGLKVYTTIDLDLQQQSQEAINKYVPTTDTRFDAGATSVTVQPGTGRILAMAQNKRFADDDATLDTNPDYSAVNFNTDFLYGGSSGKQPGSTFKVFTLAEWLNEGHALRESFNGLRRNFTKFPDSCDASGAASDGTWYGNFNPRNDDSTNASNALNATVYSVNSAFVAMAQKLDLCKIRATAEAFGVHRADENPLLMTPAAVLGTNEVAPLTMAVAFAGIANNGIVCDAVAIDKIEKFDGTPLTPPSANCRKAVEPAIAAAMQYALIQAYTTGTGTPSKNRVADGIPAFSKTGTTDDAEATWMIGGTTKLTTAVWVGNIQGHANLRNRYFNGIQAASVRHYIWPAIMKFGNAKYGGDAFPEIDGKLLQQKLIDIPDVSGLTPAKAAKVLTDAGFVAVDGGTRNSSVAVGLVSGTDPSDEAPGGSTVTYFTSKGRATNPTPSSPANPANPVNPANPGGSVPDLSGQTQGEAEASLRSLGFVPAVVSSPVSDQSQNGRVIVQHPPAGSSLKQGGRVTISVGKYYAPATR